MDAGSEYTGNDFQCDVALAHPERLTIVHETGHALAFHHTRPDYETHIVVAPKAHIASLTALTQADEPVARELFGVVQEVAREIEPSKGAARVILNVGEYQESQHLHVHVVSGPRRSHDRGGVGTAARTDATDSPESLS